MRMIVKNELVLYHYYELAMGPFVNLSDLPLEESERILEMIRAEGITFASRRSRDYLTIRRELESKAREMFIAKGGKPIRRVPHYMTLGECPWLLDWYKQGQVLKIPLENFSRDNSSFTYGDLFPTMRYKDGKPYREQVYTMDEIMGVIQEFGFPQEWNAEGKLGPERYIEAQIWDDAPIRPFKCQDHIRR